jgi:serine protease Do
MFYNTKGGLIIMSEYIDDNNSNENENEVFASDIADMQEKSKQDTTENPANVQENAGEQGGIGQDYSNGTGQNPGYSAGYYGGVQNGQNQNGQNQNGQNQSEYNPYGGNVQYKWNYDDYQKALNNKGKPPRKKNKGLRAFVIIITSVAAVALITFAGLGIYSLTLNGIPKITGTSSSSGDKVINPNGPTLTTNDKPSGTTSSSSSVSPLQMSNQQVYNAVKNSVVTIEVFTTQSVDPDAEGSGIIESADGYIITNEHVIDGAKSIVVVLANNKQYTAKLEGSDLRTDLAVIKVDATGLTPASFGNSDQITVAESVLAIGNPGGLGGSVTEGIISAVNRAIPTQNNYTENCIQTDAPINPGNSGGALVNMYGQVIGITSSKIEATGYEGMGFAIPINTAQPVINSIIKYGYVTGRVKIGISVQQYEGSTAYGYPAGLQILTVDSSSDAATKGLKVNDIITKINGIAVTSYDQFYQEESKYKAGDTVTITVYRYTTKSTFDVSVKLAEDKGDVVPTSQQNSSTQNGNGFGN